MTKRSRSPIEEQKARAGSDSKIRIPGRQPRCTVWQAIICALSLVLLAMPTSAVTIKVSGTRILKDDREFVVKGVGINGINCWWPRDNSQDAALIADCWKFNTVRASCRLGSNPAQSDQIAKLVNAFTSRGIVIMFEIHDFTGDYPDANQLSALSTWHKNLATKYKDNPLVWMNVMNEPGKTPCSPKWLSHHETVIKAIRATGNTSIIVCDGTAWGQDVGTWNSSINESNSALLTYGKTIAEKFSNVIFSTHLYDQWCSGDAKMIEYIKRVQERNLCLIFGEYGIDNGNSNTTAAVKSLFNVAPPRKIGRIAWHWDGGDGNKLTVAAHPAGGWRINRTDGSKPTNLSSFGEMVWNDTHTGATPAIFPVVKAQTQSSGTVTMLDVSGRVLQINRGKSATSMLVESMRDQGQSGLEKTVQTQIQIVR